MNRTKLVSWSGKAWCAGLFCLGTFALQGWSQTIQTNLAVLSRHGPQLNGNGRIVGSVQQASGDSVNLNSGLTVTGDLLAPGTPTVVNNGNNTFGGTLAGSGSAQPTGYQITLNANVSLRYLRTHTTPPTLPTVSAPPSPTGTRSVTLGTAGQNPGDFTTLRDLTLQGSAGLVAVPPGNYGNFMVNGGTGLVFGVAGGLQTVAYNLQNLTLNGNATLKVVGPVVLTIANGFSANGLLGASNNPAWLTLQISGGGFTLNSGSSIYGSVVAPNGTVIVNGGTVLLGACVCDRFTLNGNGIVQWSGQTAQTNLPPVANSQSVTNAENTATNITLSGSDPQGGTLTYTLLTSPAHGTLSGNPPNLVYLPATNYFGSDAFTFRVNDTFTNSATATVSITINQVFYPPVAFAQSLTNLEDTSLPVTLTGHDPQGLGLTFLLVSSPTHGTLSGPPPHLFYLPATNYFGNDAFTFKVNNGLTNSATASITITNIPVDDPPQVFAGFDQLIILPTNSVSLAGTVVYDAFPGTVDSVLWSKVSGPGTVAFAQPANPVTTASFSQSGIYRLRLTASDSFLIGSADVVITVDAPPTVNAGPSVTNTLPGVAQLAGFASDDGIPTNGVLTVVWSKVSGPGTVLFGNPAATNTTAMFSTNGIYVLRLTADDGISTNHSDVTVIANLPPLVNAGADILTNGLTAMLNGSVTDDGLPGSSLSIQWSQTSGPGVLAFSNSLAAVTAVTASQSGTYILHLTATDGAATNTDEMVVTFNLPPVVNAGEAQTVNAGATVTLAGSVTDDHLPHDQLTSLWTELSGPGAATFADATVTNTTVTFDQPGTYMLRLTGDDTLATTSADVVIRINAAPVVSAGPSQQAVLGGTAVLYGTVTDDGLPSTNSLSVTWTLVSGPGTIIFDDPNAPVTGVGFMMAGTYVLRLTATDTLATNSDETTLTVSSANHPPVVAAGQNQTVLLPASAALKGFVTDDGLPVGAAVTWNWSQVSGPGTVTFANSSATNTTASFSAPGNYVLRLTASDTASTGQSDVRIAARTPEMNEPPQVSAGTDLVVGLTNAIVLRGFATDDGLPTNGTLTVAWSQVSGPGAASFDHPSATNTQVIFSSVGTYVLQLAASDSALSANSTVKVTVYPFNQPPVVDAGPNQTLTLPDASVLLPNGDGVTNAHTFLSASVTDAGHWDNTMGQPGLDNMIEFNSIGLGDHVFVSGLFAHAGGVEAHGSAQWDGTNWSALYDPRPFFGGNFDPTKTNIGYYVFDCGGFYFCNETLNCIGARGPEAFAGGDGKPLAEDGRVNAVARWSGTGWEAWEFKELANTVYVIRATTNMVYVGGYLAGKATNATSDPVANLPWSYGIMTWDGTNWGTLGSGVTDINDFPDPVDPSFNEYNAVVTDIAVGKAGEIYAAGDFTMMTTTGLAYNIVKWNGHDWEPLGSGIPLPPNFNGGLDSKSLAVAENGDLYVSGAFSTAGGVPANKLARWDGQAWHSVGLGQIDGNINTLATHGNDLFVGGGLRAVDGLPVKSIARWDGQQWYQLGSGEAEGAQSGFGVFSLAVDATGVYVGGSFAIAGGQPANNIAKWVFPRQPSLVAYLEGSVTDDGLPMGSAVTAQWSKASGPGDVTFGDLHAAVTTASFSQPGAYVLQLTGSDTQYTTTNTVTINVVANRPPVVDAGSNQVVGLSQAAIMNGTVTDDGLPTGAALANVWSVVNGPGTVTFEDPRNLHTAVRFSDPGTYVLRLAANDTQFGAVSDVTVEVLGGNRAPDLAIVYPSDSAVTWPGPANEYGSVFDDGLPNGTVNATWSQVSGPGTAAFSDAGATNAEDNFFTQVWFSEPGTYVLRLTATDSQLSSSSDITVTVVPAEPLQSPIVFAGPDQQITLPANAPLHGVIIYDGAPTGEPINWSASGPGNVTFNHPNSPVTTASFDQPGAYQLTLSLGQFWWDSITSTMNVFVLPQPQSHQPPQLSAGPNRTVPVNVHVQLSGSIVDDGQAPGGPLTVAWSSASGPGNVVFDSPNAPVTTATFSSTGQYLLLLSAEDPVFGAQQSSFAIIDVYNPAVGNLPPVVNVGDPQTVLYTDFQFIGADVSDDGLPYGILNFNWAQVSGPVQARIFSPNQQFTPLEFSYPGAYTLRLTVDDGQYTNSAELIIYATTASGSLTNAPPFVDAGPPQNLMLPTNSTTLAGVVTDDSLPDGSTLTYTWSVDRGFGDVTFSDTNALNPTVTFDDAAEAASGQGWATYQLRLTADDGVTTNSSVVQISIVDSSVHTPSPSADAGPDATITLPDSLPLEGSFSAFPSFGETPPPGSTWTVVNGPALVNFEDVTDPLTTAHFLAPGIYLLRLTATDGVRETSSDVTITVNAGNLPPVVNAGGPQSIPFTNAIVQLHGTVSDDGLPADGALTSVWGVASGPGTVAFADATAPVTTATFSALGTYVLSLTASDSVLSTTDYVAVVVFDPSLVHAPPFVDAGTNQTITLVQSANLNGFVASDGMSGYTLNYFWYQAAGPGSVNFADSSATNTTATFSQPGTYVLGLGAYDAVYRNDAYVTVTVLFPTNEPPFVNAGFPQVVLLSQGADLAGLVTDDGLPANGSLTTQWSVASGPGAVTFSDPAGTSTHATFSAPGNYTLRLTANDSALSASSDVTIMVDEVDFFLNNQAPAVTVPDHLSATTFHPITLGGTASDDGSPVGSQLVSAWNKVSGPGLVLFGDGTNPNSTATFYLAGVYVLQLTASDGQLTGSGLVTVNVDNATNLPPEALAGADLVVTRPEAAVLDGVVLDDGLPLGFPLTYQWSKVSGPGNVSFVIFSNAVANVTPWTSVNADDSAPATATFSAPGVYVLRLSASDTQFIGTNDITVTVLEGVNTAPLVDAGPPQAIMLPSPAILHTGVVDDGLPDGVVEIGWSQVSGPGSVNFSVVNGNYYAWFTNAGNYVLQLSANDGALAASNTVAITVYDATTAPQAAITTPTDGSPVTAITPIIGTASSPLLQSYQLQYRLETPADTNAWIPIATGSNSVVNGTLGSLDPTLSLNGVYELRLTVTDITGQSTNTDPITVIFDRNLKVGNFSISFNDLSVPMPGMPIQITRKYDSLAAAAGVQGDFGIGWTLDINNVRLQKNRPLGKNWVETSTGSPFDFSLVYQLDPGAPRIVTITFPGGQVQKFQLNPNPLRRALDPIGYPQWQFTPLDNTLGTLVPATYDDPDGNFMAVDGAIPGTVNLYDLNYFSDSFAAPITQQQLDDYPTLFRYTSAEGYRYLIDEIQGLQSVTDPNGNTLVIGTNGLTWTNSIAGTNSLSIAFQRDTQGRITNIVDALGKGMNYQYDTNGNLAGFTDRTGLTNGFGYTNTGFPHYLTSITDARGVTPVQNQYDASGRLVANVDAFGNTITYGHDLANNREYVTNRLGFVAISDYDNHGNVVHVVDAEGGEIFSTYDEDGNVLTSVDQLGRTNTYTYDDGDNRLTVTDPLGNTTYFSYNSIRRITRITDPRGNTVNNVFDDQGNLLSMTDPLGNTTRFAYNNQGQPVVMTNALGQIITFAYDDQGHLTNEVDALGHETDYERDLNGNLLQQTTTRTTPGGLQTLTVQFQYDDQNRLTNSVFPDGSSTRTFYNAIGKPAQTIDQLGRQTVMAYDDDGNLTQTTYPDGSIDASGYDAEQHLTSSTNRLGQVTQYQYDPMGRIVQTIYSDGTSSSNHFDMAGQLIAATEARGNSTFYDYDASGRSIAVTNALGQVSRSFYDPNGNLTNSVDALGRSTSFVYDTLNRQVKIVFADGTTQTTFYDELGRRTYRQDQAGKVTAYGYDGLGRLTAVTNALGYVTSYAYDELGQQISQTDANNHTTTFEYDSLGRRVKRTLPGNQIETYAYNPGGQLTNRTDFNGYTTTYQYDLINRLLAKIPDSRRGEPTVTYSYNVLGLRTNMTDGSGTTAYLYDGRNRLAQKTRNWGGAGGPLAVTLNYSYDAGGNLTNIVSSDPNGVAVAYEYDALDRLGAVDDVRAGRTAYGYDAVGNLQTCIYPNGIDGTYQYDALNRLTNLASWRLQTAIGNYAYAVGPAGNRTNATEQLFASLLNAQSRTINRAYAYDDVYRLAGETIALNGQSASANYAYDPVGNRLTRGVSDLPLAPQLFDFDADDRLNTDSYDANGNTLFGAGFGQTQPDQYDFENRLTSRTVLANGQTTIITAAYDGDGNRVSKTVSTPTNSVTAFYVVDDQNPSGYAQVLEEYVLQNFGTPFLQTVYTYGHTLISQTAYPAVGNSSPSTSFYGCDGHNSVRYLTDLNGDVTDTYDYDAFGNLIAATGGTFNNYLFTGEQYDADLGLYYLRARYQNADTGRFWTQDSSEGNISDPSSLHKYTYCGNSPLNAYDPSGHDSIAELSITTGLWTTARALFGATIGGLSGSLAAGYDAILHGQVSNAQIDSAMAAGFSQGATTGAILGGLAFGSVGSFGVSGIGLIYSEMGYFSALQSYGDGDVQAGDFEATLAGAGAVVSVIGLTRGITQAYTGLVNFRIPTYTVESLGTGEIRVRAFVNGQQVGTLSMSQSLERADTAIANDIYVQNAFRGAGSDGKFISTEMYRKALDSLGWPRRVIGTPNGVNMTAVTDGIERAARTKSLRALGYDVHAYLPETKTMVAIRSTTP